MEARKKRHIKGGYEFDHLFPKPAHNDKIIRRDATLEDTMAFIPKVVRETLWHTEAITRKLKGRNVYDTCRNIWEFIYGHINYRKDEQGFEQIRSPARTWRDRHEGVDCDCYSVFISTILTNLGIPHSLRIARYYRSYFQHIYPIVPNGSRHITMDCVTDQFDYEVSYTDKKDYPMDLQYLDGLDGETLGLFGRKKKKKAAEAAAAAANAEALTSGDVDAITPVPAPAPPKKKGFLKKVLNVVNKVNPATVLLRNGVLAAMKLNIKNVAKRLRWSYLPPDKIAQHGIDPERFQKLVTSRQKLENLFYGAGGKPENLRKAILGGKGNSDKAVNGLGMLPMQGWSGYMNEYTPLGELLGYDIYHSENIDGMEGFQGFGALGEPVTLASVGAAMGVVAGIVASLKQVGDIFKNKSPQSVDFDEAATEAPENNVDVPTTAVTAPLPPVLPTINPPAPATYAEDNNYYGNTQNMVVSPTQRPMTAMRNESELLTEEENNYINPSAPAFNMSTNTSNAPNNPPEDKQGFWEKNKKWITPVAIGTGGLVLIAIGFKLMKSNKAPYRYPPQNQSLAGLPRKKKKNRRRKHLRKQAVTLL